MADKLTPEQRHKCMSHIHGKDTKPELWVRKYLYAHGFRYRLHVKRLPGSPDIVIRRLRTVILVNGCFWHGHTEPPLPSPVEEENGEVSYYEEHEEDYNHPDDDDSQNYNYSFGEGNDED